MNRIGETVRAARMKHALSLEETARRAGLTYRTVWNVEQGDSVPQMRTLRALATALELDVAHLTALIEDVPA